MNALGNQRVVNFSMYLPERKPLEFASPSVFWTSDPYPYLENKNKRFLMILFKQFHVGDFHSNLWSIKTAGDMLSLVEKVKSTS